MNGFLRACALATALGVGVLAGGTAGAGLQPLVYQVGVRLLFVGEQQGPLEVQHRARDRQYGGEPVAANNVWAQVSPGQGGLPSASCLTASANRPVRQA